MRRVRALRPVPYTGEILMLLQAQSLAAGARFVFDAFLPAGERPAGAWRQAAEIPRRAVVLIHDAARQVARRRAG